jgi:hypothetical protein
MTQAERSPVLIAGFLTAALPVIRKSPQLFAGPSLQQASEATLRFFCRPPDIFWRHLEITAPHIFRFSEQSFGFFFSTRDTAIIV